MPRRLLRSRLLTVALTTLSLVVALVGRGSGRTLLVALFGLVLVLLGAEEHQERRYRQRRRP